MQPLTSARPWKTKTHIPLPAFSTDRPRCKLHLVQTLGQVARLMVITKYFHTRLGLADSHAMCNSQLRYTHSLKHYKLTPQLCFKQTVIAMLLLFTYSTLMLLSIYFSELADGREPRVNVASGASCGGRVLLGGGYWVSWHAAALSSYRQSGQLEELSRLGSKNHCAM